MSTQPAYEETLSQYVARRLRGRLAELQISGSELARRTGIVQQGLSRRIKGDQPWTLDELQLVQDVTGISVAYLLGLNDERTPSPSSDGVRPFGVRPPGLEPGTHWLTPERPDEDAQIIPFEVPAAGPETAEGALGEVITLFGNLETAEERVDAPLAIVVELFGHGA